MVHIDTVLFYQVTDPQKANYEIDDYATAIGQLSTTILRSVIGSMDLEHTLTSRDKINDKLRDVLDEASGKWGIRVTRVEIKALHPASSIMDAMEKQYRAQRAKHAAILVAEGQKQAAILKADGDAAAIGKVFKAIHDGKPDPELLAYQFVQALPQVAQSQGSSVWVIPSDVTTALRNLSSAFGNSHGEPGGRGPDVPPPGPGPSPSDLRSAGDGGPIRGKVAAPWPRRSRLPNGRQPPHHRTHGTPAGYRTARRRNSAAGCPSPADPGLQLLALATISPGCSHPDVGKTIVYGTKPPASGRQSHGNAVPPRSTLVSAPGPPRHPAATLLAATPALFHPLHRPGPPGLPGPALRARRRLGPRPGTRGPDPGHVPPPADHRPHQGQQHDHHPGRLQVDTVGDRPGREQADANHDPEQGLHELARMVHPRIAGAHETRELRIIPVERLLDLLELTLLVFWERHDPSPEKTLRRARAR